MQQHPPHKKLTLLFYSSLSMLTATKTKHFGYPYYKKLRYRRVTARCVVSVVILPIATQQCRNYLYDKSWPNWWYEVGGLVGGNVSWTMCTQPWRDRLGRVMVECTLFMCSYCLTGVMNKPTTVELCISPVYRRLAVAKFSKSTM